MTEAGPPHTSRDFRWLWWLAAPLVLALLYVLSAPPVVMLSYELTNRSGAFTWLPKFNNHFYAPLYECNGSFPWLDALYHTYFEWWRAILRPIFYP